MDALVDMADSVDKTEQPTSVLLSLNTLSSRVRRCCEVPNTSSLPSQNILCPHCDLVVTAKTYRRHLKLFFNFETGSWMKDPERTDSGIIVKSKST